MSGGSAGGSSVAGGSAGGASGGASAGGRAGGAAGGTSGGSAGGSVGTPTLVLTPQQVKTFHFTWADVAGETEYRLLESHDGIAPLSVVATLPANTTSYDLVVPLFRRLGAQYVLRACNGGTCRDSQPTSLGRSVAGAIGYVKASNAEAGDSFGVSVALSADGNTLAVGAKDEKSSAVGIGGNQADNSANASGAVYIFTRSGSGWSQQAYLKASNSGTGDWFGCSVALSDDGSLLAVGAFGEDSNATGVGGNQSDNSAGASGAVYVFSRTGANWSQEAYIKASNTEAGDMFGAAVALSADASTLAVSARYESSGASGVGTSQSDNSATGAGAVYVFVRTGTSWSQQAYVKASNTDAMDFFGWSSLALSADGNTLAVGAPGESSDGVGANQSDNSADSSGAVYVFLRTGAAWAQQAFVKSTTPSVGDCFGGRGPIDGALAVSGSAVALSGDGNSLAVGAWGSDTFGTNDGAVVLYSRSGTSWSFDRNLSAPVPGSGDSFGLSVAFSGNGNWLAVGAQYEDGNAICFDGDPLDNSVLDSGAVYVFSRAGGWLSNTMYVKASNTGGGDRFGSSLAVSGDGSTMAVGAPSEASRATGVGGDQSDNSAVQAGALYLY